MSGTVSKCKGLSDSEIIIKSLDDLQYFACLYDRYEKQMLNYILKISGFSKAEAEDILQDSFIKIWTKINDFDPELSFKSWLYRIVHNNTISVWRSNQSRSNRQTEVSYQFIGYLEPEDLIEKEITHEQMQRLHSALSGMKSNYREVIILKFFENLSYEEISDVLKIPEGTVATRINRAKKQIHNLLGGSSFFD